MSPGNGKESGLKTGQLAAPQLDAEVTASGVSRTKEDRVSDGTSLGLRNVV